MSVQIIIEGKHSTDVLSELKTLSEALSPSPSMPLPVSTLAPFIPVSSGMNGAADSGKAFVESDTVVADEPEEEEEDVVEDTPVETAPKALKPREHKKVADKMIADREIDTELYGLLNEKHKTRVDAAFAEYDKSEPVAEVVEATPDVGLFDSPVEVVEATPDVGLFDSPVEVVEAVVEEPVEEVEEIELPEGVDLLITPDTIRDLIQKVAIGADGKDDPAKYAKVREIMRTAIPANIDVKISNIPVDKVEEVYYEIAAV